MKKLLLLGCLLLTGTTASFASERALYDGGEFSASSMFDPGNDDAVPNNLTDLRVSDVKFELGHVPSSVAKPKLALSKGAYHAAGETDMNSYLGERFVMGHSRSTNLLVITKTTVEKVDETHVVFKNFFYNDVNITVQLDMATGDFVIPAGQFIMDLDGAGKIHMCRMDFDKGVYSTTDAINGKLYDGAFHIEDGYGFFVTEGAQVGAYLNTGLMEYTAVATPNATMTNQVIGYGGDGSMTQANQEVTAKANICYVYPVNDDRLRVMNLLVRETTSGASYSDILINLGVDGSVTIDPQVVNTLSLFGDFCVYGMTEKVDATGKITYSVSQITPITAKCSSTGKILSWGSWAVANPSAGILSANKSTQLSLQSAVVFPQRLSAEFEGEGTQSSPWLLQNASDLMALSQMVQYDTSVRSTVKTEGDTKYYDVLSGKYFRISADIDMSALKSTFAPIGNTTYRFDGVIDGDGHVISKLRFTDYAYDYCSLIGVLGSNGSVRKLTVDHPYMETLGYNMAPVVARNYGLIDSVTVISPVMYATKGYNIGGVVSYNYGTVSNSTASDVYINCLGYTGGISGRCISGIIDNCHASGRLLLTGGQVYGGGISGYVTKYSTGSPASVITDCSFSGSVSASGDEVALGGITGAMAYSSISRSFANVNLTNYSAKSSFIGGIVGSVGESSVTDCYVSGWVRNPETANAGGLAGHSSEYSNPVGTNFKNCYTSVMLTTKSADAIRGLAGNAVNFNFENCYYDAQVAAVSDEKYARTTSEMTTAAGLQGFSADTWTFADGLYPRLKGMAESDVAAVSASPLVLDNADIVSRVEHNFKYGSAAGVNWEGVVNGKFNAAGGYAFSFDNGEGKLNYNQFTDTIYVSKNNVSKYYIVNIVPVLFKGLGTQESPWLISSKDDLKKLSEITNNATMPFEGKYFALTNDIDCEGDTLTPICKDATGTLAFAGTFDGCGHTVDNYVIQAVGFYTEGTTAGNVNPKDPASYYNAGLFGNIGAKGLVKNLTIGSKAMVNGFTYVGAIAGNSCGTVENCANYSMVTAYFGYAGGMVGTLKAGGVVTGCYNNGPVRANGNIAGGIVASAESAAIANCENTGKVSAYWFNAYQKEGAQYLAGGIAGQISYSTLTNVVNSGEVSSYKQVGGISGKVTATAAKPAVITNAVNYGLVYAWSDRTTLGLVAGVNTLGQYVNCYADKQLQKCGFVANGAMKGVNAISTNVMTDGAIELPDSAWTKTAGSYPTMKYDAVPAQVALNSKAVVLFAGKDCASSVLNPATLASGPEWTLTSDNSGAFAIADGKLTVKVPATGVANDTIVASDGQAVRALPLSSLNIAILDGDGTAEAPFLVNTTSDFLAIADLIENTGFDYDGYSFKVTANLDFEGTQFKSIASNGNLFNGIFDGNGKSVLNVKFEGTEKTDLYRGLFGTIGYDGTVKNLTVDESCVVSAYQYAGGIAGALYGSIINCINRGAVSTNGTTNAGGIAGVAYEEALLSKCANYGTVQSKTITAGGILGGSVADAKVTVESCRNEGNVTGTQKVGGIVGSASAYLSDCVNAGQVTATASYAGGIMAEAMLPSGIMRATNKGIVTTPQYMGGVIGTSAAHTKASSPFVLEECVNEVDLVAGAKGYAGGIGGSIKAGAQIRNCHNSGNITRTANATGIRIAGLFSDITSTVAAPSFIEGSYNTGNVTGYTFVAGICSYFSNAQNDGAWMRGCYNTGDITGAGNTATSSVGGLLANGGSVIIEDSWNSGDITGAGGYVGGLVGQKNSYITSFARNFNTGSVKGGNSCVGGLIGYGRVGMVDCSNFGSVTGTTNVAGMLGYSGPVGATLYTLVFDRSYNAGAVKATAANGVTANIFVLNTGTSYYKVSDCYFDADVNPATAQDTKHEAITGLSTAELCNLKIDDAFETSTASYPMLKVHNGNEALTFAVATMLLAEGDSFDNVKAPFLVGTPEGAVWTATDNLVISGNTVTPKPEASGDKATLTLTVGNLTRSYEMTLTGNTTGIDDVNTDNGKAILATRYYGTDGREISVPTAGSVVIERTTYTDGTTSVRKYVAQ